jgi:hypothetical protein
MTTFVLSVAAAPSALEEWEAVARAAAAPPMMYGQQGRAILEASILGRLTPLVIENERDCDNG